MEDNKVLNGLTLDEIIEIAEKCNVKYELGSLCDSVIIDLDNKVIKLKDYDIIEYFNKGCNMDKNNVKEANRDITIDNDNLMTDYNKLLELNKIHLNTIDDLNKYFDNKG